MAAQPRMKDHATALVVASGLAEAASIGLLLWAPTAGLAIQLVLLIVYTVALRRLPPGESCACFGALVPDLDRDAAMLRNVALSATVAGVIVALAAGARPATLTAAAVATSLLLLSPAIGRIALKTLLATSQGTQNVNRV